MFPYVVSDLARSGAAAWARLARLACPACSVPLVSPLSFSSPLPLVLAPRTSAPFFSFPHPSPLCSPFSFLRPLSLLPPGATSSPQHFLFQQHGVVPKGTGVCPRGGCVWAPASPRASGGAALRPRQFTGPHCLLAHSTTVTRPEEGGPHIRKRPLCPLLARQGRDCKGAVTQVRNKRGFYTVACGGGGKGEKGGAPLVSGGGQWRSVGSGARRPRSTRSRPWQWAQRDP